jgi:hypothetical protein
MGAGEGCGTIGAGGAIAAVVFLHPVKPITRIATKDNAGRARFINIFDSPSKCLLTRSVSLSTLQAVMAFKV